MGENGRGDKRTLVVVAAVAVAAASLVGARVLAGGESCHAWQQAYLELVEEDARGPSADGAADLQERARDLEERRPPGCRVRPSVPVSGETKPGVVEGTWPPTMPLVTSSKDPSFTVTGYKADLVDDETFGLVYEMTLDLSREGRSKSESVLCDVRFLNAEGISIFQRDEAISWADRSYLDDWPITIPLEELEPHAAADGAPAAATISCDEYY